uniref:FH2 domain containing 3 n=1 Tax=Hucho hucho TaxID=62062 RepID=A0A4W5N1P4_9TELE
MGCDAFSRSVHRRSKMRNFNWDAIPRQSVLGKKNVWTSQSQRPMVDFELDTQRMEEMFSRSDTQLPLRKTGSVKKTVRGLSLSTQGLQRVMRDMVDDVRRGNWLRFGAGKLKELCKLLPDEGEKGFIVVMVLSFSSYEERLRTLMLREEFFPLMDELKHSIAVMTKAANELLVCDDLHSIIRLVLKAGNYMNAGGYAGSAIGFRMASLLKLADTKANKPGMNLLHYVTMQAQEIDVALLNFPEQLQHIGMAARVQKQEVESDFQRETEKVKEAKIDASTQPELLLQMETFLMARLADLQACLLDLNSLSQAVAEYFCEDPATFQLEVCCSIFYSFCERFNRAVQENRERETAELRRRQRERFCNVAKRRSTATCSDLDPHLCLEAAGPGSAMESILHSFLTTIRPRGLARRRHHHHLPPVMLSPIGGSLEGGIEEDSSYLDPPSEQKEEEKENEGETVTPEDQWRCFGSKRASSINQKRTPKSCGRRSLSPRQHTPPTQKEEKRAGKEKEEVQRMCVVSRKMLRYQTGRGSAQPSTPGHRPRSTPHPSTPRPREMREVDLALCNSMGNLGSPWTILSPHVSPQNHTLHRRHSFSAPSADDGLDDGVWSLPPTPTRPSSTTRRGPLSLPDCPSQRALSQGPMLRSLSLDETGGSQAPGFRFRLGDLFQRCNTLWPPVGAVAETGFATEAQKPLERQNSSSGIVSFFRRFGERRRASMEEQDSRGTYT